MGLTKNYASTLYSWLNTFAPTYRGPLNDNVFTPQNPKPNEYIIYSAQTGNFGEEFIQSIAIYSKSTGYTKLMEIVDNIESAIGENGKRITTDWGYLIIKKGSPFSQDKEDDDKSYRANYINLGVTIYQFNV